MSTFGRKQGVIYFLLTILLSIAVSMLTEFFMSTVDWDVFTPQGFVEQLNNFEMAFEARHPWVARLSLILPFAAVILASMIYFWPFFFQNSYLNRSHVLLRRIANLSPFIFIITLGGWLISSSVQYVFFFFTTIPSDLKGVLLLTEVCVPTLSGALIGILLYYLLELVNQSWIIPRYFHSGEILKTKGTFKMSIRGRFIILLLSVGFLPLVFINLITYTSGSDLRPILLYSIFFLLISLLITLFLSQIFRRPLIAMDGAAQKIQSGQYDQAIRVSTADELGRLSHSLNQMALGLKEKDRINEAFGRVVDPVVRDHLLKGEINLGGELCRATVLFSDIRNFTGLSEELPPDQLVSMLNRYFTEITAAIEENGGLVNKFIGDAVMALFGAPLPLKDHEKRAVQAALAIRERRDRLNSRFRQEGLPELLSGVGLHSGQLIAGNIGSLSRMEYTAIGDTVNVAARLESSCKQTGKDIILSEDTRNGCSDLEGLVKLGRLKVKGRQAGISIYTI